MLIRWATADDKPAWIALAKDVADIFDAPDMPESRSFLEYMDGKIAGHEALIAVDRMSGGCIGAIGFSRAGNRISWFAVHGERRGKGAGTRLLGCALRQLDAGREATVVTFSDGVRAAPAQAVYRKFGFAVKGLADHAGQPRVLMAREPSSERRGGSFHYRYPEFIGDSRREHCPIRNGHPSPDGHDEIAALDGCFLMAEYPCRGNPFGKMRVMPKARAFHFEDMPASEMAGFMRATQRAGRALRKVTGAVKINYEMRANSGAHPRTHLFPRYLDDGFPSAPIDCRATESPYESRDEYLWLVERMREELREHCGE